MSFAFADVDLGRDNDDDDDFRSFIRVVPGDRTVARKPFAFPGVDAEFSRYLGARGRSTVWFIDMIARDESHLKTFETAMDGLQSAAETRQLTERDTAYPRAFIESFAPSGPRVPLTSPWAFGQQYVVRFRVI